MGSKRSTTADSSTEVIAGKAYLATLLAWLVPGAGHYYLGERSRGVAFFLLVLVSLVIGCLLGGNLYSLLPDEPLNNLLTIACMGMGAPYFFSRFVLSYSGDILAPGFDYGGAFVATAGLMNLLLILDAWDIGRGRKE